MNEGAPLASISVDQRGSRELFESIGVRGSRTSVLFALIS
jgi:hypothetical protein